MEKKINYNRRKKAKKKKEKIQKNLRNKSKHNNNKHFSWVIVVRVLSLAGSHSLPHLPRMPSDTVLVSGLAVGTAQILIWPYSCVFLPPMSTAITTNAFSFAGALSGLSYAPQTQSLPIGSCGFNLQLVQVVGRFGVFFLSHISPGFQLCFYFHLCTGVCSWGCPGGLGSAPVKARYGGGAAACVAGVLAAPGTQGSGWLGQQEIQCSRRVWQPVLANTLQYSCLENPTWQRSMAGHSPQGHRVGHDRSNSACIDARLFFCLRQLCSSEGWVWMWHSCLGCRDPASAKCTDTNCLCHRSYGPIRGYFRASCSWCRSSPTNTPVSPP